MDSPPSEKSQTRYSTPVSDLDDHRNQPEIPRAHTANNSHHHTVDHLDMPQSNSGRPELLQAEDAARGSKPIMRDFEQVNVDDDKKTIGDTLITIQDQPNPSSLRCGPSHRLVDQPERIIRSRESSTSSRSISPPNSVDAFADPRRRARGNTFGSKAPSDLDVSLQRTVSGGTHHRRPTFSNGSVRQIELFSSENSPEEDVCFPKPEDPSKTFKIDYEELEEFVAQSTRGRPPKANALRQRLSFSSQANKPKATKNLSQDRQTSIPRIIAHSASPARDDSECAVEDAKSLEDVKVHDILEARSPMERRPSFVESNRYSFFSSEIEQTIHASEFGDLVMPGETFRDLFELPPEGGVWWLDVLNPSEDELEMFQEGFGIHRLTTEDIKTQEIREKVELFKQYYFVCFRSFYQMDKTSDDYMDPVNVYMVVFREGIITFTYTPSPHAANVRKRIGNLRNYISLTSDWICYAMVDNIVDGFAPVIHTIELETDQIEDQVFVARSEDFSSLLRQIGECRKKVMSLMRLLGGKADVIKGFAKRCNEQYSVTPRGEIGLYLGDIQDHVVTMMSNLGHFEKMLSRSHSNYLAQLSVDNISQGNHANRVLSKITLIATVLVPLNLICGLFGMNVPVPGRGTEGLQWFFGIVGVIAAIVVGSLVAARRYRFI